MLPGGAEIDLDEDGVLMDSCYGVPDIPMKEVVTQELTSYKYTEDLLSLAKCMPHSERNLLRLLSEVRTPLKVAAWEKH